MTKLDAEQIDLIRRAKEGDRAALTILLKDSRRWLAEQIAYRIPQILKSAIDEDDIVQQAHVQAFRSVSRFEDRGPDSFQRWLKAIALGKLRDAMKHVRAAKRYGPVVTRRAPKSLEDSMVAFLDVIASPVLTPSHTARREEKAAAVRAALEKLPEHYRQAVSLVYLEGKPVAEAAETLGRTARGVHGLCRRALEILREQLQSTSVLVAVDKNSPRRGV